MKQYFPLRVKLNPGILSSFFLTFIVNFYSELFHKFIIVILTKDNHKTVE